MKKKAVKIKTSRRAASDVEDRALFTLDEARRVFFPDFPRDALKRYASGKERVLLKTVKIGLRPFVSRAYIAEFVAALCNADAATVLKPKRRAAAKRTSDDVRGAYEYLAAETGWVPPEER